MLSGFICVYRESKKGAKYDMASTKGQKYKSIVDEWLEEDQLMLLSSWARDGYTLKDIANKMGIGYSTLNEWRKLYPEIREALQKGREFVDYQVENALLKSALGYKTKEVKTTIIIKKGVVVEEQRETINKESAPNVAAIQTWLFNRRPDKWKRNRDNLLDLDEDDTRIQVTVTRAPMPQKEGMSEEESDEDKEWQDEVNQGIEIRRATKEEQAAKKAAKKNESNGTATKVEEDEEDLDYWPDDWEDEDEEG